MFPVGFTLFVITSWNLCGGGGLEPFLVPPALLPWEIPYCDTDPARPDPPLLYE